MRVFVLSPDLCDGSNRCVVKDGEQVIEFVRTWLENEPEPGDEVTIEVDDMSEQEMRDLPGDI
jgi:hypothetical protein